VRAQPERPYPAATVRVALPEDAALLAELGRRTFRDTFEADNTPQDMAAYLAGAFGVEQQAAELADPATTFLIVEVEGEPGAPVPAAYARLISGEAPDCIPGERRIEVRRFYTDLPWIGRGVAATLMAECVARGIAAGCDVVWLDVWQENPRAVRFYAKHGFEVVGEQDFVLGSDVQHDFLMARTVGGEVVIGADTRTAVAGTNNA
jgi:ribosomal protein S18 acetylase RimI-like enzyme